MFDPNPQFGATSNRSQSPDVAMPSPPVDGHFEVGPHEVTVELTLDTWHAGYTPDVFDQVRIQQARLTRPQAVALKMMSLSLNKQAARMADGRFVQNSSDALRYLLDQVAKQLPAEVIAKLDK